MKNMKITFGEALKAMKEGEAITRKEWTGSFVFMQNPSNIPKIGIHRMQSLPKAVKQEFSDRFTRAQTDIITWDELHLNDGIGEIVYRDQFAKVNKYNVVTGWTASVTDILAEDWEVL